MADKKEILTAAEIGDKILSAEALKAYKFATDETGGEKTDEELRKFILRRGELTAAFKEIAETQKHAEQIAASLKAALKKVYSEGPENLLPDNVQWAGYQYTYSFMPGSASMIAKDLISKGETTDEKLFDALTVAAMAKAAGLYPQKLMERYAGITSKAKERVLYVR